MYVQKIHFEETLVKKTNRKGIETAYQKNDLSIILNLKSNVWYIEKCSNSRTFDLVYKEMKKHFPKYRYLYDLSSGSIPS